MSIHELSSTLAKQLETIKNEKGAITIEDTTHILEKMVGAFAGGSESEKFMRDEITTIAKHIKNTKAEILALSPSSSPSNPHIGTAAVQLDAVVKATEEAAHTIMDAADEIQNVVGASKADDDLKNQITDITARIYEACNFQDLTGQRIKKVMTALDFTESKIQNLIALFSGDGTIQLSEAPKEFAAAEGDKALLNGPQLNAPTQAEIDAMFGGMKP